MIVRRIVALGFCTMLVLASACGQGVQADIPVPFTAGTKALPPGTYSFTIADSGDMLAITPPAGHGFRLPVLTRLHGSGITNEGALVFDRVGNVRYLSEVWIIGQDGLQVSTTNEKHIHEMVPVLARPSDKPPHKSN